MPSSGLSVDGFDYTAPCHAAEGRRFMSDQTSKKPSIKFSDVLEAYELSDFGAPSDVWTFLDLEIGAMRVTSETCGLPDSEDPADREESDSVIALPTKHDL